MYSGYVVGDINKVKLHRAWFVLGLVTYLRRVCLPVFSRPLTPTQPGHPSMRKCSEDWEWIRPPLSLEETASSA